MTRQCRKCGATWEPRVVDPVQCPRCKRCDWKAPKKGESVKPVTRVTKKAKVPAKTTLVCPACGESKGIVEWGTGHRCNDCKRNF